MLHEINLLAWRATRRAANQRRVQCLLGFTFGLFLIASGLGGYLIDRQVDIQQQRLTDLNLEHERLNARSAQQEKREIAHQIELKRFAQYAEWHQYRNQPVELMNMLAKQVSEEVVFSHLELRSGVVTAKGETATTQALTQALARMEATERISKVTLHALTNASLSSQRSMSQFHLSFTFRLRGLEAFGYEP